MATTPSTPRRRTVSRPCSRCRARTSSRCTTPPSRPIRRCASSTCGTSRRAVFAAEATGKLTRTPGLAVLTAGPGVTNGVSPIAQAHFAGSPLVTIGGRAPAPLGHAEPPGARPPADLSSGHQVGRRPRRPSTTSRRWSTRRSRWPGRRTGGRRSSTCRWTSSSAGPTVAGAGTAQVGGDPPRPRRPVGRVAALLAGAERPVLVLGTDVWADRAEVAALRFVEETAIPVDRQRHGPRHRPRRAPAARHQGALAALKAPTSSSSSARRWTSGSATASSAARTARRRAQVVHLADSPGQVPRTPTLAASAAGDLTLVLRPAPRRHWSQPEHGRVNWTAGPRQLRRPRSPQPRPATASCSAEADPIHPARIYGELLPRLADDAVVIGDGGDFVSFAGKFVEPKRPGGWLDPGPYGCLGAGLGAAMAARHRPSLQPGRAAVRRRRRRHVADRRRHARAPQPAGRHGRRQQLGVGPGEGARCSSSTATTSPPTSLRRPGTTRS